MQRNQENLDFPSTKANMKLRGYHMLLLRVNTIYRRSVVNVIPLMFPPNKALIYKGGDKTLTYREAVANKCKLL